MVYIVHSELSHHGILGQKWGKRNGPPYPLNSGDHSASEKKAGYEKSIQKKNETKASSKPSNSKDYVKSMANKSVGSISPVVKEAAIQLLAPLTMIAVSALIRKAITKKAVANMKNAQKKELDDKYKNREIKSLKDTPKIMGKNSPSEGMKVTNPGYPDDPNRVQNCTFCTTALAMREKGYDVQASSTPHPWLPDTIFGSSFKGAKDVKMSKAKKGEDIVKELSKHGEGAYGGIAVFWKFGGGHSMFYKIENGKPVIYDGQRGVTVPMDNKLFNSIVINRTSYQRLDNCDPTEQVLAIVERRK